jgi:LacI family transcriptional regulator
MQPSVLHVVTNHHFHSINLTMDHLYELGYRRIGIFASRDWDAKVGNAWLAGLLLAKRKYPALQLLSPLLNKRFDFKRDELISTYRLEAVVSFTADLEDLRQRGFSIPGDIGFASLDVSRNDTESSGVYENDLLIGMKAMDVLVGMLHRSERGLPAVPVSTLVEGEWRAGKTLPRLR